MHSLVIVVVVVFIFILGRCPLRVEEVGGGPSGYRHPNVELVLCGVSSRYDRIGEGRLDAVQLLRWVVVEMLQIVLVLSTTPQRTGTGTNT